MINLDAIDAAIVGMLASLEEAAEYLQLMEEEEEDEEFELPEELNLHAEDFSW